MNTLPTIVIRHKRENLKKCSLSGLEKRSDLQFYSYPLASNLDLREVIFLTIDAPPLSKKDEGSLLILDATWRLAQKMESVLGLAHHVKRRSIPHGFRTAYPRRQTDCKDPFAGLSSLEALYVAHLLLGKETSGLLDHYHWKEEFLEKNRELFLKVT